MTETAAPRRPAVRIGTESTGAALPATPATNGEVRQSDVHLPEQEERARTPDQERAYWAAAEPDIEEGLWESAEERETDVVVCEFDRIRFPLKNADGSYVYDSDGTTKKTVPMRVRFLKIHDTDVEAAARKATYRIPNPDVRGGPKVERVDAAVQRCWVIYQATVPDDRKTYWDRPSMWQRHKVGNGPECIEKMLDLGEKMQAVAAIYGFSGLVGPDSELDRVVKPSAGQTAS